MLTVSALVSVLLAATAALPLRVEITSPKTRLFIFEPVKLTVRATAIQPVIVPPISNMAGSPAMETWVDYGNGFTQYLDVDHTAGVPGEVGGERSLGTGDSFVKTAVLVEGRIGDELTVLFPTAGRYSLRVVFRARPERDGVSGVVLGESTAITFEVVAPDVTGMELLQRIRTQPWILRGGLSNDEYAALLAQFPGTPYLHWGKRAIALTKQSRIGNGRYPDNDEVFDEAAQGVPLAKTLFRELATELLNADTWGQFDEERLFLAAENMERGRAYDEARPIWAEILQRFPGSEAAEQARNRLDSTPPSLLVSALPLALWPPNHQLVPITVSVQVTDDQDPNPVVKLVSITCDDGCDLARDITGAAFGTDDRQFALRSERRGTGTGRTYKITYSARDAAGNVATGETTVIIAHDQGRR
jgi:hypothetical protein